MARSVAGLFPDRESAERAIVDLKDAGFDASRIGIVMRDKQATQEVTEEHGTRSTEGAVTGGVIGGSLGAILAATGALVIPGIGPFISGGILATALVGGTAGWLVGGLAGIGIPKEEAEYYENAVQQGRALVTVDAQGRDAEARAIMLRDGAEDLQDRGFGGGYDTDAQPIGMNTNTNSGQYTTSTTNYTQPATNYTDTNVNTTDNDIRIPVREEELVAGTRRQEEGRVHIHKEVIEEPVTANVQLQREEVRVEHVPYTGDANATNLDDAFTERDIDVPLMGETVVAGKRVQGVEEVRIHKNVVTENQQVTDTVRKERVVVDGVEDDGTINSQTGTATNRVEGAAGNLGNTVRKTVDKITGQ